MFKIIKLITNFVFPCLVCTAEDFRQLTWNPGNFFSMYSLLTWNRYGQVCLNSSFPLDHDESTGQVVLNLFVLVSYLVIVYLVVYKINLLI